MDGDLTVKNYALQPTHCIHWRLPDEVWIPAYWKKAGINSVDSTPTRFFTINKSPLLPLWPIHYCHHYTTTKTYPLAPRLININKSSALPLRPIDYCLHSTTTTTNPLAPNYSQPPSLLHYHSDHSTTTTTTPLPLQTFQYPPPNPFNMAKTPLLPPQPTHYLHNLFTTNA